MVNVLQKIYRLIQHPIVAALVALCLMGKIGYAQSNVWPDYLSVPQSDEEGEKGDSNWLKFNNKFSWYENVKELNTTDWRVETTRHSFTQTSQYLLKMDNRETREHTFSLPGSLFRKNVLFPSGKLGIEWIPKLNYKIRSDSSTFHSTIDLGPVAEAFLFSVPLKVRTGVSTDVWDETMVGRNIFLVFKNHSWDAGYYLEGEFGDYSKPVLNMPLFFNIRASGRSIRDAALGLVVGNVLYTNDIGSGDSIVLFVSDSLSNGRESYLNQGTMFTTSPWRILHNFSVTGGLKGAERFGFCPYGYYNFNLRTIKYPAGTELYNDMKGKYNKAGLQLSTQNRYFFTYNGGIELGWNNQDWMYNTKNIKTRIVKYTGTDSILAVAANNEKMLATANNKDNLTFTACMDHDIIIPLLWKFSLLYNFRISRESKNYQNYFLFIENGSIDTIRNQLECDGVEKFHHLELSRRDSSKVQGGVYCDYGMIEVHNLRKSLSGTSSIRKTMKIGGFASVSLSKLTLSEDMFVQGEKRDFIFKKLHMEPSSRPQQQRDFYSLLSGAWAFNEFVKIVCIWNERFGDDGKWYGKEYISEDMGISDYYAIENKKNDYIISMHLDMTLSQINISAGGSFRDTYTQSYNAKDTSYIPVLEGYSYIPFVVCEASWSGFTIKCKVKRDFNTIDPERWSTYKNWDITFLLQKEW